MKISWVNGQPLDNVSIKDRGLAYGDGCFTTALVVYGNVLMLDEHLQRLSSDTRRLAMSNIDFTLLIKQVIEFAQQAHRYEKAVLKILITAGSSGRGYSRDQFAKPNIVMTLDAFPSQYHQWQQNGIHLGVSKEQLGINPRLAGIKHLNRLEQVLVKAELDQRVEDELIVTDINGNIVECCSANVFWLQNSQWQTPSIKNAGVNGLVRQQILNLIPNVIVGDFPLSILENIEAMFISNAILGIVAVRQFNQVRLDITKVRPVQNVFLSQQESSSSY